MIRLILPLIVFLLFIFEGTIFQLLAPDRYGVSLLYIPRFMVIVIIFISIYLGKAQGVLYGVVFGFLYDVVYTEMLGLYMFVMGLVAYLFALNYKPVQRSFTLPVLTAVMAIVALEYFLYGMYYMLNVTVMQHEAFLWLRLYPTIALNLLFAAIILLPFKKFVAYLARIERTLEE